MKKLTGVLLLLMVVLVYGASFVKAANYNTKGKDNMTYDECIKFQDKAVTTSGSVYFGHCIKATCYSNVWQTQYYISSDLVKCSNGNTGKYVQIISDGCSNYTGSCDSSFREKYCSIVAYYDCGRTKYGSLFTTTRAPQLTTPTTKKPTTKQTTKKPQTQTTTKKPTTQTTTVPVAKSSNNFLQTLSLSVGTLNFDKMTETYDVALEENISYIEVTAIPEDPKARVSIENEDSFSEEKPIIITVYAEDDTTRVYVINFKIGVQPDNNKRLAMIAIDGYDLDFNPDIYTYNLKIKKESKLEFSIETESPTATYNILGNDKLKKGSQISIIVTAEDGSEVSYLINISKSNNSIAGFLVVIIILGITGFVGYKLITGFINKKEGESHYEYE